MERATWSYARSVVFVAVMALALMHVGHAHGAGIAGLMVSKSIPAATVAVIDPESGTSSGGSAGTDVRISPGDVILFRMNYFAMPDAVMRGLGGYITDFIPSNTEVVGVRLIDANGRTVRPNYPGIALDGCAGGGCGGFTSLSCTPGVNGCPGSGTRSVGNGSLAQLHADTGIFFSNDARTARTPATTFLTYTNGLSMAGRDPVYAANIAPILGLAGTATFFGHTAWDVDQIWAFGISNTNGNASGNQGRGNTPHGYGSPVAGPLTHYQFEATDTIAVGTDLPSDLRFNNVVGPWQRVLYPGSTIGTGTSPGTGLDTRRVLDSNVGFDVRPAAPLAATAIRAAVGALRAGEGGALEIALRVLATPLDGVQMADVNCAEMYGAPPGSESPSGTGGGGEDNVWGFVIPSPACVYLNNLFDLTPDRALAAGGQTITYTLHGKNLSTLPQTNVIVTQDYDGSRVAFVSASGAPTMTTCAGGRPCLQWNLGTLDPGEEYTFTSSFTVGGTGQISVVSYGNYRSTQLPAPGFTTQGVTLVRATPLIRVTLAPAAGAFATAGGTIALSGNIRNEGTNDTTLKEMTVVLPAGLTLVPSSITVSGTAYAATAGRADLGSVTLDVGQSRPISIVVRAAPGTPTGLYDVDFQVWATTTGYGGDFETYFQDISQIPVGAVRSAPPELDCPILSNATTFAGATTEANGTNVRVFLNAIQRATGLSSANRFVAGTVGAGSTFGRLYGGLEVTATAQAPGELESLPSAACFVTFISQCSDGFDNDADGAIDFPTDPGCSSPTDNDERNPQCSDGMDNDGDGLTDWPADFECTSADDNLELGTPACANGVDDDGDGLVDLADTGCTGPGDRDEVNRRRCSDGIDNDGDGRIDFGPAGTNDAGCHSANDDDEANFQYATGDVRARLLLVFDTSGSMNWNVCADDFTGGDGSTECLGTDVSCAACGEGGCGNSVADDSRMALARAGVTDVVSGFGDVELGLMRFHQRASNFQCPGTNATAGSGGWAGAGAVCGAFASADLLVGFSPDNEYSMLEWVDGSDNYSGTAPAGLDFELRGSGTTPIAGSLDSARTYLTGVRGTDTAAMCRPYRVILLTDGAETCGGDPIASATALRTAGYPVSVIGFATRPDMAAQLNGIAAAGGTTSAIFANDSVELSSAIADIVNDSILIETCNGLDDDCDTRIDEGFVLYCNRPGVATQTLCTNPGETICNGVDDNCDGRTDEGLRNACGTCGAVPSEVCNGVDDDCDGIADEGGVCAGCIPSAEICDGINNDCDAFVDEALVRPCGTEVGACSVGTETCTAGAWGACSGTVPAVEACNNIDDNCDGVIDGLTQPCGLAVGACVPGVATCTAGTFGACIGARGATTELCNNIDDDCDGTVDDGNPGGMGTCGTAIGECDPGAFVCTAGALVCMGGRGPALEACNNLDDDCDGRTDESIPTGAACGTCGDGRMRCVSGMMACTGDRTPGTEVCNGVDDDCDSIIDDGNPGAGVVCGTAEGACAPGNTVCRSGRIECDGSTGPVVEACNVIDDDCDGVVDEGNPGGGASCGGSGSGECELGSQVCVAGALVCVGESGPRDERCDGLDNDCDGMTDEGNPGGGVACGDGTGECVPGTTLCMGGTLVCDGSIGPTAEVCNMLDDDCDGVVDDGLSLGAPCGTDEGECVPGILICSGGATVCDGAIGPMDETCNALDDDCDAAVDEALPLGAVCGSTEGSCMPGMLQCVDGVDVCVGEVPRGREACDCEDNDCDGMVDEPPDTGSLCPAGTECLDCACALPCTDSEFMRCPSGRIEVERDGRCFCVAPRCDEATCSGETVMGGDGAVVCTPDESGTPVCTCRNNECTFPCDGVACTSPTVCAPDTGMCVIDDCRGLGCPTGQLCDLVSLECMDDPCATAGCDETQVCRDGTCETSCGAVDCGTGERCASGVCVEDLCATAACPGTEVCDPATGECGANMCVGVACTPGTVCDPVTGDCERNPCTGVRCPMGDICRAGECERIETEVDAGMIREDGGGRMPDGGIDGGPVDDTVRVLAAGGGGCLCRVGAGSTTSGATSIALLMMLGLFIVTRRASARRRAAKGGA